MKISTNYNTNLYNAKPSAVKTVPFGSTRVQENQQENDNTKKILIGSAIGLAALVLILKRKSVSGFLKKLFKAEDSIKPETPRTEPPRVETPKVEPPKEEPIKKIDPEVVDAEIFDAKKTMSEYKAILKEQKPFASDMTEEEKAIWNTQDEKRMELRRVLKENNVSLVEKEEFSLDPTKDVEAKRAYFTSNKVTNSTFNEASRLDYIEMFEKYGDRYWVNQETGKSSLFYLTGKVGQDASENLLNRYINIMDRLAQRDNTGMRDAVSVSYILKFNAKNMSEETALKFINVLKKISFQQQDGVVAEFAIKRTKLENNEKVQVAIKDLKESLKDFPYQDKTIND